ncbi:MaoC-like dehydratase domain [Dillenia turbinata]|uniref:MaoC-like dehydratase domain n=1 Tax=Dillenia turbinata TaxID=194707 RepID=A0AAN8ZM50_9MAGN
MADSRFHPDLLLSHQFPEVSFFFISVVSTFIYVGSRVYLDWINDVPLFVNRDAALYALGVGACAQDAIDDKELKYVYHENGQQFIQFSLNFMEVGNFMGRSSVTWVSYPLVPGHYHGKVLPTFVALFPLGSTLEQLQGILQFDPRLLLHGQQYIEIYKPLPSGGCVKNKSRIAGLHDKGKAAVVDVEILSYEENSSEPLCMNRITVYLRGAGGFSESSHPYSYSAYPAKEAIKIPKTQPFAAFEDRTQQSQACNALLYRLSGDYNPLHSDPKLAEVAGFSRPILHGLCTLGFAVRAIVLCVCKGDSNMVKSISGRFLLHVYPGESLITEMWLEGFKVIYQTKVKERSRAVLSGHVDLKCLPSSL